MKKTFRIRTEWASLARADDGVLLVGVKSNGVSRCIYFESLEQLRQALENKELVVRKWAIIIPSRLCIIKTVALPASDIAEAAKMIEFELPSLVPLPAEQLVYGCSAINKQFGMLNVLVCIVRRKVLAEYLKPLNDIGIEPLRISLDTLAIHNWFCKDRSGQIQRQVNIAVDDLRLIFLLSEGEKLISADEIMARKFQGIPLCKDIQGLILNHLEQIPMGPEDKILIRITGPEKYLLQLKTVSDSIQAALHFNSKVEIKGATKSIPYSGGYDLRSEDSYSIEAIAVEGLLDMASASKMPHSNLLPAEKLRTYRRRELLCNALISSSLAVGSLVLLWLSLAAMSWRIEWACRPVEAQIAPIEHIAETVETKRERLRILWQQLSNRGRITQIMEELYKYTPRNISISKLTFTTKTGGVVVEIKGQTNMLSDAFDYTETMRKATLLKQLQIENAQQVPVAGGSIVQFSACCFVKNDWL